MNAEDKPQETLYAEVQNAVIEAMKSEHFVIHVSYVKDERIQHENFITKFPHGDHLKVMRAFGLFLEEIRKQAAKPS